MFVYIKDIIFDLATLINQRLIASHTWTQLMVLCSVYGTTSSPEVSSRCLVPVSLLQRVTFMSKGKRWHEE